MFKNWHKLESKHQTVFAVIIAFAVIAFWRGVWGLLDKYLFPQNELLSLWASVFLGLGILLLTGYAVRELA